MFFRIHLGALTKSAIETEIEFMHEKNKQDGAQNTSFI